MITGKSLLSTLLLAGTLFGGLSGQSLILDRVTAVVGEFMILQSDIESLNLQNKAQGINMPGDEKCVILENFLIEKLLVNQAKIDSIEVSESSVEMELDNRLSYLVFWKNHSGDQGGYEKIGQGCIDHKADAEHHYG
jgi:peptidyl-prolyl cis-trans isomerase SurA